MKPTRTYNTMNWKYFALGLAASAMVLSSCTPERSGATGWAYNDTSNGGFEKRMYAGQETAPGLVFIEGGFLDAFIILRESVSTMHKLPRSRIRNHIS